MGAVMLPANWYTSPDIYLYVVLDKIYSFHKFLFSTSSGGSLGCAAELSFPVEVLQVFHCSNSCQIFTFKITGRSYYKVKLKGGLITRWNYGEVLLQYEITGRSYYKMKLQGGLITRWNYREDLLQEYCIDTHAANFFVRNDQYEHKSFKWVLQLYSVNN